MPPTTTQPSPKRRSRKRILIIALAVVLLTITLAAITLCQGGPRYYNRKYDIAPQRQPIAAKPANYTLEKQIERHTCGFHSVCTVYRAFGVDPQLADLRFRLGTDRAAYNFDDTTLGTLHPDMLRVMQQDGFACELILTPADNVEKIQSHLAAGFPAIILTKPAGLHWTVLTPGEASDSAIIYDSLQLSPVTITLAPYVTTDVINAILVKPSPQ